MRMRIADPGEPFRVAGGPLLFLLACLLFALAMTLLAIGLELRH